MTSGVFPNSVRVFLSQNLDFDLDTLFGFGLERFWTASRPWCTALMGRPVTSHRTDRAATPKDHLRGAASSRAGSDGG